ncbi:glycosyl hydrolase [Sphingomonas sp. DG1-23]|uniref:glycosyl hydrolase n=1 Tax=Sphingomonas sp. DG1-23 TaxID=3068316 RepID=UPI00273D9AFC|nr:glycosyl hydrolase [Sphingomonas sp. DG1-23]MDP5281062.1 glycosyl hydrolase [Sphingomonas sp. DG1-23]
MRGSERMKALAALSLAVAAPAAAAQTASPEALWRSFLAPPDDARPMLRWWWFGPAVTTGEIDREIRAMKAGGFGGFEVQPVYPLSPDSDRLRNLPYLSDPFIAALRHAARTGRAEGMRVDVTGGSGWPFGGPHIPIDQAAASIRMVRVPLPAGAGELMPPAIGPGETLVRATLGATALPIGDDAISVRPSGQPREALFFVAGRTGQQVKRAALGAEGYVLDHIDPAAVANHLQTAGNRLLEAFAGGPPPDAFFSDSLEAYGSSWTGDLPAEFQRRRGYDLMAHLPALFLDTPESAAVRFDWARTLSELVDERYLAPIDAWARKHGTQFRAQVYGFPPPTLSSNALVALPEGEGADWRSFTSTRWATSAAHLYGKPLVSSEVWTWLHSPSWAATPLDMKVEADRHFLQGVTQLIGHGWPYSPPEAGEPGWAFYAAAALNDHNPWYGVMPDVTRYLQRASFLLRQGEAANSVAIYLPIEDAFAAMRPEAASVNEAMHRRVPDALIGQVLDAGYGLDFVDASALATQGVRHKALVLPRMERIDAAAYAAIAAWVEAGGRVISVGGLPSNAGGLRDGEARAKVQALSRRLRSARSTAIVEEGEIGRALAAAVPPDLRLAAPTPALGFVHRRLAEGDLYFIVNTGNTPLHTAAHFLDDRGNGSWWDALRGRQWPAGSGEIAIDLAPYESRFLLFAGAPRQAAPQTAAPVPVADGRWTLSIADRPARALPAFASWTSDPVTRYFSGTAVYRGTFDLAASRARQCLALDFGTPTPRDPSRSEARPFAALNAPVRDAARVWVNGAPAGSVWAPPYRLGLPGKLRAGRNVIEIRVSNTAVNRLAGRPRADYRLLHARFGERFTPQDQDKIAALPSGLLAAPRLVSGSCD